MRAWKTWSMSAQSRRRTGFEIFMRRIAPAAVAALGVAMTGCEDGGGSDHDFGDNDPRVYVAFGDSITRGSANPAGTPYPARLAGMLGATVVNEGHSGERSAYGVGNVGRVLSDYRPGYLLILFGANDVIFGASSDSIVANLREIVLAAKANKTVPVLATLTPAFGPHSFMEGGIRAVNPKIRDLASEQDVGLADLDNAFGWNPDYMLADGLHPNDAGDQKIAAVFRDAVR